MADLTQEQLLEQAGLTDASKEEQRAYLASLGAYDERAKEFDVNYFDKDDYIGSPFTILEVVIRKGRSKKGEDDWAIKARDPKSKEEGIMTFDKNPQRDDLMSNFVETIKKFGAIPGQTLQELPQSDALKANALTIVPIGKWRDLDDLEADRLAKKQAKKKARGK